MGEAAERGMEVGDDRDALIAELKDAATGQEAVEAPGEQEAVDEEETDFGLFRPVGDDDEEDEETEDEYSPAVEVREEYEEGDEYEAPEVTRLKKQLEHERTLRLRDSHRAWVARYEKMYPLADLRSISATSRRSFEKQAREQHNRVARLIKPHIDRLEAQVQKARKQATEEARGAVHKAWGKPTTGPGIELRTQAQFDEELASARRSGNLERVLRVMRLREEKTNG
jgi:molecular chaperone GrpE (heat shock protein)